MMNIIMVHIIIFVFSYASSILYKLYFRKQTMFGKYSFVFRLIEFITSYTLLLLLMKANNLFETSFNFGVVIIFSLVVSAIYTAIAISFTVEICRKKDRDFKVNYLIKTMKLKLFPTVSIIYLLTGLIIICISLFFANNVITDYQASEIEQHKLEIASLKKTTLTAATIKIIDERLGFEVASLFDLKVIDDSLINLDYPLIKLVGDKTVKKSSDTTILIIGDSFVWGQIQTNMNNVYWNQLSYELTARGYSCTVYGVGMGGDSTYDELKWLTDSSMLKDLDPDIVIIGYVPNDPDLTTMDGTVYGIDSNISISFHNNYILSFLKNVFGNVFYAYNNYISRNTLKNSKDVDEYIAYEYENRKYGKEYLAYEYELVQNKNLKKYEKYVVKPLSEFAESSDLPIVIMTTPSTPDRLLYANLHKPVISLFEKYNIKTYDFSDAFCNIYANKKHADNYTVLPTDLHPGTATNYFYAQYIADWLQSDYPELLGKKSLPKNKESNLEINDWTPYELDLQKITSSETEAVYTLSYPKGDDSDLFLNLPIYKDYVMVSFQYPVNITSITISGDNLASATLYYNSTNPDLGYDDLAMHKLGKVKGSVCKWTKDENAMVTSLCIHADITSGTSEKLTLTVRCD